MPMTATDFARAIEAHDRAHRPHRRQEALRANPDHYQRLGHEARQRAEDTADALWNAAAKPADFQEAERLRAGIADTADAMILADHVARADADAGRPDASDYDLEDPGAAVGLVPLVHGLGADGTAPF